MLRRPPRSTRTDTLFPYTTLFRSQEDDALLQQARIDVVGALAPAGLLDHHGNQRVHDRFRQIIHGQSSESGALQGIGHTDVRAGGGQGKPPLSASRSWVPGHPPERSEERRVGNEGVSTARSRWSPVHYKKHKQNVKHLNDNHYNYNTQTYHTRNKMNK